jgi:toxin ParE1/3/4
VKVIWSPTAERNLDAIWEYIAQDNIDAADRMTACLHAATENLVNHPRFGRDGRSRDTRELVVADTPYILIYRISRGRIDVVRVLHGKQHWPQAG